MAKDYNTFTDVSTGDVYTAAAHNLILENLNNHRVPPMCKAVRSGNLSYTSGTGIAWNAEDYDTDGMHDTGTNPERITINTAGLYLFVWNCHFTFTGTWNTDAYIEHSVAGAIGYLYEGSSANATVLNVSAIYPCAVGEYVQTKGTMTGVTSTSVIAGAASYLSATWIGQVS